jgi:hypothetical protein
MGAILARRSALRGATGFPAHLFMRADVGVHGHHEENGADSEGKPVQVPKALALRYRCMESSEPITGTQTYARMHACPHAWYTNQRICR